ncbi:hypothetical protein AbraIFM66951_009940 [Aspergillus brasiliensis]|nr:hypothetical protein AbraIFM66951_009940 [Aspergillus brasiliensis]
MESPHQIFLIPEVLESVLLHLDLSTILLSQRVCHLWNALIQTSPSLQTALFFRPELEPPTQNEKPERAINPFLNQLLNHFVSNHEPGHDTAVSSYLFLFGTPNKSDPSLLELKQKHAYLRPEASWRGMLLHQPPVLSLAVSDDLIPLTVEDIERKAAAFLRLKHLERLVEEMSPWNVARLRVLDG